MWSQLKQFALYRTGMCLRLFYNVKVGIVLTFLKNSYYYDLTLEISSLCLVFLIF